MPMVSLIFTNITETYMRKFFINWMHVNPQRSAIWILKQNRYSFMLLNHSCCTYVVSTCSLILHSNAYPPMTKWYSLMWYPLYTKMFELTSWSMYIGNYMPDHVFIQILCVLFMHDWFVAQSSSDFKRDIRSTEMWIFWTFLNNTRTINKILNFGSDTLPHSRVLSVLKFSLFTNEEQSIVSKHFLSILNWQHTL